MEVHYMRDMNMLQWREGYELVLPPDVLGYVDPSGSS